MELIADVGTVEGARKATKTGMWGSLGFAASLCFGLIMILSTDWLPEVGSMEQIDRYSYLTAAVLELAIVLSAAFRFRQGKGWLIGTIVIVLFLLEIVGKIAGGTARVGWFLLYAAIVLALINGIRGAWVLRKPEDLAQELEEGLG